MKPINSILAARPTAILRNPPVLRSLFAPRFYSIQSNLNAGSSGPKRRGKAVTPFNDDGFVPWNELSVGEKAGRAVQQSFNFGLILVGLVLTGGVGYFLWTDVFSPDSKTANFNRAVNKVKADPRCIELLGDPNKLTAHGEETFNKWSRARPLSSTESTDNQGSQHLMMRFYVEGPLDNGVVQLHMVRPRGQDDYHYKYLFVDIKGHERIYLENEATSSSGAGKKFSFFGVKWS